MNSIQNSRVTLTLKQGEIYLVIELVEDETPLRNMELWNSQYLKKCSFTDEQLDSVMMNVSDESKEYTFIILNVTIFWKLLN